MFTDDHQDVRGDDEDWEDWVLVEREDWWKVSFRAVPWSYRREREWTESGERLPFYPRPPYYEQEEGLLANEPEEDIVTDDRLSPSLAGVQVVEDVVRRYEVDAGIVFPFDPVWQLACLEAKPLFRGDVDDSRVVAAQKRWKDHVDSLLGGILEPLPYDPLDARNWDQELTGSPSTATDSTRPRTPSSDPDVIDLTDSDLSTDSDPFPRTPQVDKKSYAAVVFDDRERSDHAFQEGTVVSPSPAKPLNASALSFVPTFSLDPPASSPTSDTHYVSATYEFHFPSLNSQLAARSGARSVPPSLQRDEHGFYNEVPSPSPSSLHSPSSTRSATPKRQSTALLPAFLADASVNARARHTSKTRELVDRLRSSNPGIRRQRRVEEASEQLTASDEGTNESYEEVPARERVVTTPDGWIMGTEDTEPASPERPKEDWVASLFQSKPAQPRPKTKPPTSASHHKRAPASTSSSTSTAYSSSVPPSATLHSPASSITSFGLPPTPSTTHFPPQSQAYYGYPPGAYGQFVLPPPPPPGAYIIPPWQMPMPLPPPAYVPPGYVLPHGPLPGYDSRAKVASATAAR